MAFKVYKQTNVMDCGPTCLRMVAKYYNKEYQISQLREISGFSKEGVSFLGISEGAEKIGFRTRGVQVGINELLESCPLPCILHWNMNHFVVLIPQKFNKRKKIAIADPARGIVQFTLNEFISLWASNRNDLGELEGLALLLEPTSRFHENQNDIVKTNSWQRIYLYLTEQKWQLFQVISALFITSLIQLIFPFLTQSIVDTGINTQNIQYITIVLAAQIMLVLSRAVIEFIRSRLLLHISVFINISLLSDFWIKLTKLPISYFDSFHIGDTLQRLGDTKRIENFLTGSALNTIFSFFNFVIFAIVLMWYNANLFLLFGLGSLAYFIWVRLFMRLRRKINYQNFHLSAKENSLSLQLVQGMQELKLNNAEKIKRWEWENVQSSIFNIGFRNLSYSQLQQAGAVLINETKNVITTFIVAQMVIEGRLTFGAMLAIQYIIGQLNGPIEQIVGFVQNAQDAKIALERINEIHDLKEEESLFTGTQTSIASLPESKSLYLNDLSFKYPGSGNDLVLQNINLEIPEGKTTAIVGMSGSGKTTLLKILLKFYERFDGDIYVGASTQDNKGLKFKYISPSFWRSQCSSVMQEGYIFNDSIAQNIAVGFDRPDLKKLIKACKVSNILSFIESLPNGFNTKLGSDGVGISQGQKQRILIARAIYKDPKFLFFDEATNALDANNERIIVENLNQFFKGRTVLVVAHRLSTVKNADKIVVLDKGKVVEEGNHFELSQLRGKYYELVKNQLELDK